MRDLRPSELERYLGSATEQPLLLDVREPWEFGICHIRGSELLPMGQIPAATQGGALPRDRDIVVICHHGIRSRQVAMFLEHQGFDRVINLQGGLDAWAREVDRDMPVY
ncbi:MAG: rhodanese-like domain-containing protein [Gammaproteobacteria bacterium]